MQSLFTKRIKDATSLLWMTILLYAGNKTAWWNKREVLRKAGNTSILNWFCLATTSVYFKSFIIFHWKLLTFLFVGCIITIEKGKTSNGYAEGLLKNNPTFGQWGLFFYCYNKCNQRDNIHHYVHIFHNSHLLSRPLINVIRDIGCGITAQFHLHISRKCHCF